MVYIVPLQTYPTALKRQLLSEGITLLTTAPSISPGLKNHRNKNGTLRRLEGNQAGKTTTDAGDISNNHAQATEAIGLHAYMLAARLPPCSTHEHKEANRYAANYRAKQLRESGSYWVGITHPEMDKEAPTPPAREAQAKSHAASQRTTQPTAGSSRAIKHYTQRAKAKRRRIPRRPPRTSEQTATESRKHARLKSKSRARTHRGAEERRSIRSRRGGAGTAAPRCVRIR